MLAAGREEEGGGDWKGRGVEGELVLGCVLGWEELVCNKRRADHSIGPSLATMAWNYYSRPKRLQAQSTTCSRSLRMSRSGM